jgi:transposase
VAAFVLELMTAVQNRIRLLTRIAFGFRSATSLIALAMLSLGGHRPQLPNQTDPQISQ